MLATFALAAIVQYGEDATLLDPADHASPSGEYVLHIDPSTRRGYGSSFCEMSRGGESLWAKALPFTFRAAAVTDEGLAVGHAVTESVRRGGELVAAILGPGGDVVFEERTKRTHSRFIHGPEDPRVRGLMVDPGGAHFTIRVKHSGDERGVEAWWRYGIPGGERLDGLWPAEHIGFADWRSHDIQDARPLPGTDLHLLHWETRGRDPSSPGSLSRGATFSLIARAGEVVWRLDLPRDYTVLGDDEATAALADRVRQEGAILDVGQDGSFEVWLVEEARRVRFRLTRDGGAGRGWRVEEVAREEHGPAEPLGEQAPPEVVLPSLESISLQRAVPRGQSLLEGVRSWTFDGEGGFLAIRRDEHDEFTRVRIGPAGQVTEEQPFEPLPGEFAGGAATWHPLGGDTWLVVVGLHVDGVKRTTVLRARGATGELAPIPRLQLPSKGASRLDIDAAAPLGDGGFVALGTFAAKYSRTFALVAFDEAGQVRWTVHHGHDPGSEATLFSPADVAVTTDGRVVVLDTIRDLLQVFDSDGQHLQSVELEEAWGLDPNYPSAVSADTRGGVLVFDFGGDPPLWHVDLEGAVRARFSPRFPDGRAAAELAGKARFAPDGTLWTSDGHSLVQLDPGGVVARTLGPPAVEGAFYARGARAILADGRICVQDGRTGALHVWAETGELLFVGAVRPEDAEEVHSIGRIVASPGGAVWVESKSRGYLGWSADGERLGYRDHGGDVAYAPHGEVLWTWGRETGVTCREDPGEELFTVDRRPGDRWIRSIVGVCFGPDDELNVLDGPRFMTADTGYHLLRFTSGGAPLGSTAVPAAWRPGLDPVRAGGWTLLSSWSFDVHLLSSTGRALTVVGDGPVEMGVHGLSPDGERLLSLDRKRLILHRRALPELTDSDR